MEEKEEDQEEGNAGPSGASIPSHGTTNQEYKGERRKNLLILEKGRVSGSPEDVEEKNGKIECANEDRSTQ